ncbi:hypothetical protein FK531_09815 [Rhodococcus spelaei]|uniref:Ribosomally synthesized peptide with SipW-like signal peptide n=1 Tax=Rhodococcus spelaei TaxID=2546320 RepID=A0A541B9P3_9NOCA|nr:SipW-dependent-type signal peptide-containing protein [Rhodococcus spelaei]TQF69065.1 hypothetical protein FK531_09815 [Rhodococcus spelaei]
MSRHEVPNSPSGFGARARSLMSGGKPRAIASLGIVLGLGAIGTLAAWSDSATATSGVFSTASVDLQLNGSSGPAVGFTTLTKTGMMPNDSVAAVLPVKNNGTAAFSYTMAAAATTAPELAPFLKVTITTGASNGTTCAGTAVATNVALVSGGSANLISTARPLAGGASESLCFQVTLDPMVTTAAQGKTVNTSFNFNATTA